ncbi:hypothetical protein FHR83_001818 [Actinoplanes campanulatus]|uniref:Uncharacterized protein n=1 Tax=Actinoplanes campanulatus TaxID=113559 RepID=A0A7W5FDC6_9ACTN|nr:hypothetical protein [Actinoplanes campanulatus]MBB3094166.1 hypothetical protein [Actinoplanes campanulatus]GGN43317.1 hypothetical protein GCM10010109_75350 [Actinoplanes campanulatus]GID42343.1 hypothetical protein Aca09nite_88490 [Actinoplanes campanulatus]
MSLQDDFLWYTRRAVDYYQVPDSAIAAYREALDVAGGPVQPGEIRALHASIVNIAAAHQHCEVASCPTCEQIRHGLAVAMAVLRAEVDAHLRRMTGEDGPAVGRAGVRPDRDRIPRVYLAGELNPPPEFHGDNEPTR